METPNTKSQIPNNPQTPNCKQRVSFASRPWCLKFGICLEFGVWNLVFRGLVCAFVLALTSSAVFAHIGDQNVFFQGFAGPYPVRVVIRPPGVIPGLSEISVRVETGGVQRVTVLPMRWNTGRKGAPPPDEAKPVRGETNLFSGELWFMRDGAQSVEVEVIGGAGTGKVIVPINAIATRVLEMSGPLSRILSALGVLLVALAVTIVGAAVRESVLPAGVAPPGRRVWLGRASVGFAAAGVVWLIWFGERWWDAEARDYHNNRLYRPLEAKARVEPRQGRAMLVVERTVDPARRNGPLVPEHGKLMHLFLVREPALDAFAHLHPTKRDWKTFDTPLPPLPPGEYRLYADVTYETGFSDTLTALVKLPPPAESPVALEADDAWCVNHEFAPRTATLQTNALTSELSMELSASAALAENRDVELRVLVRDHDGQPVALQPYMGMAGHLIVRRDDGSVFTHLHPSGSYSMTAQQLFELRAEGKAPLAVASVKGEPICRIPELPNSPVAREQISFPYAFPKPGAYRLWAQVKIAGAIQTGVFDVDVPANGRRR